MKNSIVVSNPNLGLIQSYLSPVINDHLVGNYYLTAPDDVNQLALTYHASDDGDSYVAKQHPYEFAIPPDTTIIKDYVSSLKDSLTFEQ
jgi:hypothetical protein